MPYAVMPVRAGFYSANIYFNVTGFNRLIACITEINKFYLGVPVFGMINGLQHRVICTVS